MKTIEYHTFENKADWGDGPWIKEPDKVQWQDPETGLPCLIVRNHGGALCGYVGVPSDHPLHNVHYDEASSAADLNVHGGLTYSDFCMTDGREDRAICHKVEDDEDDHIYWFGFDCSHAFDLAPAYEYTMRAIRSKGYFDLKSGDVYRDLSYVRSEVESLAKQLKAFSGTAQKMECSMQEHHEKIIERIQVAMAKVKE